MIVLAGLAGLGWACWGGWAGLGLLGWAGGSPGPILLSGNCPGLLSGANWAGLDLLVARLAALASRRADKERTTED